MFEKKLLADREARINEMQKLSSAISALSQQVTASEQITTQNIDPSKLVEVVEDVLAEHSEQQKRSCNLVVFGAAETPANAALQADPVVFANEMIKQMGLSPTLVVSGAARIGAIHGGRARPIRLSFASIDDKRKVLRSAATLRHIGGFWSHVYVKPDLTRKQQDAEKILQAELKRRRINGENVIIRRGAIIPRPKQ